MQAYKTGMPGKVLGIFFFVAAVVAGITTWAFRSGLTWTGICLLVVGLPMALLYWYVLWVGPSRTRFTLLDQGLHLKAPPFFEAAVPWEEIESVSLGQWDEKALGVTDTERSLHFGGYKAGVFVMEGGRRLLAAARPGPVVVVDTAVRRYVLGPKNPEQFQQDITARIN